MIANIFVIHPSRFLVQMGFLEVVIPPDILNEDGAPDDYVAVEGGSVRVRCKATGVPEPTVLWRREDSQPIILRADGTREKQGVYRDEGFFTKLSPV